MSCTQKAKTVSGARRRVLVQDARTSLPPKWCASFVVSDAAQGLSNFFVAASYLCSLVGRLSCNTCQRAECEAGDGFRTRWRREDHACWRR